jgi:MFS family permease
VKHDPYLALRSKGYRWLFATHTLMILGYQMQMTALSWLIYETSNSAALLGLSGLLQFLPVLLLSIPIGHLVDAHSKKLMLQVGLLLHFGGTIILTIVSLYSVPLIVLFGTLVLIGAGSAFGSIARPSLLRETIADTAVENASNWNSIGRRVATILGPIAAGILIAAAGGAAGVFLINGLCLVGACYCTHQIKYTRRNSERVPLSWKTIGEGMMFIGRSPLILSATLLDMFAVMLGGAEILLPIYAKDILMVGPVGLGFLVAAASIGSLLMTFILAHRRPFTRAGISLLISVGMFGLMVAIFGVSRIPVISFLALVGTGVFDAISVSIRSTILQLFVPERLRGRVFGVNMIFIYSSNELGAFESGVAASVLGTVPSVVFGGVCAVLVASSFAALFPELRKLGKISPHA